MKEVYALSIHDEDTFQILGIYDDYLKADEDKSDFAKIIRLLQEDRKQWINQYTRAHNDYVLLQQENNQLKEKMNEILDRNIKYNVEIVDLQQENQQLKENKEGWQRLANKYFNALEDIKEYLKENEKEYGSLEDNEKIILDIVNKVLGSDKE